MNALARILVVVFSAAILPTMTSAALTGSANSHDSSLACDATLTDGFFENREDMEIEIEQRAAPSQTPSEAPSSSPSLLMPCSDAYSNARGSYTTFNAPCVISFHNEEESEQPNPLGANRKRYHKGDSSTSAYYHGTSNVCESENKIGEAKEYVTEWPDECVGDFSRCYDLKDPSQHLCQSLRKILEGLRDVRRLEIDSGLTSLPLTTRELYDALVPPGTTHISVDCRVDKEAFLDNLNRKADLELKQMREKVMLEKERTLFDVASILVAVLISIFAISKMVVQPIVGALGGGFEGNRQGGRGRGNNQLLSLVSRDSGLQIETDGYGEEGDLEEDHVQAVIQTLDQMETEIEISTETNSQLQQIPMDFDAVPIVPATIIPMEAVPVQVIQDGAPYYQ